MNPYREIIRLYNASVPPASKRRINPRLINEPKKHVLLPGSPATGYIRPGPAYFLNELFVVNALTSGYQSRNLRQPVRLLYSANFSYFRAGRASQDLGLFSPLTAPRTLFFSLGKSH